MKRSNEPCRLSSRPQAVNKVEVEVDGDMHSQEMIEIIRPLLMNWLGLLAIFGRVRLIAEIYKELIDRMAYGSQIGTQIDGTAVGRRFGLVICGAGCH